MPANRGSRLTNIFLFAVSVIRNSLLYNKIPSCRLIPTCSHFTREALKRHGALKGILLAGARLLRCHPLNPGGIDPVP